MCVRQHLLLRQFHVDLPGSVDIPQKFGEVSEDEFEQVLTCEYDPLKGNMKI